MPKREMNEGVIRGFRGSHRSGLATLIVETDDGLDEIMCDNAPTVRALDAAFGDCIGEGHTVNEPGFVGKRIRYDRGPIGVLAWFIPIE